MARLHADVNPLQDSSCFGIDIYMRVLEIVVELLQNETITNWNNLNFLTQQLHSL